MSPPAAFAAARPRRSRALSPFAPFIELWEARRLIGRLVQRELSARYRGSLMGFFWMLFTPLLMLFVYFFAFAVVFKARWAGAENTREFALLLFSGLTAFSFASESINRASTLVLENPTYVKKVVFPLEILPAAMIASNLANMGLSLLIVAAAYPFVFGVPPWTVVLVPVVLLPLVLITLGVSWLLASIGVFLRDVRPIVGALMTAVLFLSPIFYPLSAVPENIRPLIALNPFSGSLEQFRGALFWGTVPGAPELAKQIAIGWLIAWAGWYWFKRTKKAFADVL